MGVQAKNVNRLKIILGRLNASSTPQDMDLSGLQLHALRANRKGIWPVKVNGNWRITLKFRGEGAYVVDYEDYH